MAVFLGDTKGVLEDNLRVDTACMRNEGSDDIRCKGAR